MKNLPASANYPAPKPTIRLRLYDPVKDLNPLAARIRLSVTLYSPYSLGKDAPMTETEKRYWEAAAKGVNLNRWVEPELRAQWMFRSAQTVYGIKGHVVTRRWRNLDKTTKEAWRHAAQDAWELVIKQNTEGSI